MLSTLAVPAGDAFVVPSDSHAGRRSAKKQQFYCDAPLGPTLDLFHQNAQLNALLGSHHVDTLRSAEAGS
jgi:hypothetical protein